MDHNELAAAMAWETEPFVVIEPKDGMRAVLPESWWSIVESDDPAVRCRAATDLWNDEFIALIPRFAEALKADLVDVRVVKHSWIDEPTLDYVLAGADGYGVWVGENPLGAATILPPVVDWLPEPALDFLRRVHGGYTTWDRESCGIAPPSLMKTLAEFWGDPHDESAIDWFETRYPAPQLRRLLRVTGRGPHADLLVSPDLPPGSAVTYFEPDFELKPFGEALDDFLMMPLEA